MQLNILHLSDIHATAGGDLYGEVDGLARIRALQSQLTEHRPEVDVVLVTGDIIDRCSPAALAPAMEELERLASSLGAALIPVVGNHDVVAADRFTGLLARRFFAREVEGLRLIVVDSSSGQLDPAQLEWLEHELRERPCFPLGTVLCLHHSPLTSPLPALQGKGLRNPAALGELLRRSGDDVRLLLTGHYHHAQSGSLGAHPVWSGPALSYRQIMLPGASAPAGGADAPGYCLLSLTPEAWSVTAFPLTEDAPLLFGAPPQASDVHLITPDHHT
ncbi:metallophosphoesterase [Nesterenkonia xinjiangensis]|uniref:3',5'-cyclic AMP phosphodiesterase CpdA n=1 Tax=Nesterenkonia xinjiangensis TaxID=225327 RepID=A0A7Z0KAY4_9MICC|nr:metallophosphoesterase [Nesterenkonia xinjiangensis]NYJ79383.1 3',5'-cyclic AMP phosphodiesterase CpdA [Nesterenkonia xinjiangensis]